MKDFRVVIVGAYGKMGREIVKGILQSDEYELAGAVDISGIGVDAGEIATGKPCGNKIESNLPELLDKIKKPCAVVDFTRKDAAAGNIRQALKRKFPVVVGTTGWKDDELAEMDQLALQNETGLLIAPNFSLGACIMMKYAAEMAKYFNQAEIIEYHNDRKVDSPSGTAMATAKAMCGEEDTEFNCGVANGSVFRGGEYQGIRIHSVRMKSLIAHQEVLFGGTGEMLTIRHDSFSRECFIPGILMAIRKAGTWQGLKVGLNTILD